VAQTGAAVLDPEGFDAWATLPGDAMVVFAEDPERFKETLDLAVIVPELHAARRDRFRVALLPPVASRALAARYGFARWPAFVMLRDGQYVGAVDGIRDWDVYLAELDRLLAAAPSRRRASASRSNARMRLRPTLATEPAHEHRMRPINIPIRSLMPEPDDAVEYMPMPREMSTFEMPRLPEPGPGADVAGARDVLEAFLGHFDAWLAAGGPPPAMELAGLAPDALKVLNETLAKARSPRSSMRSTRCASRKPCSPASGASSMSMPPAPC